MQELRIEIHPRLPAHGSLYVVVVVHIPEECWKQDDITKDPFDDDDDEAIDDGDGHLDQKQG